MKCHNCLKEIPDGAKSCGWCEARQDPEDLAFEESAMKILQSLDPAVIADLKRMSESAETGEDFASMILCPPCPACDSEKVELCTEVAGIENPCVGRCKVCCALFCTECAHAFRDEKEAAHSNATARCPSCGGSNTSFPEDDDEEFPDISETIECFDCGGLYCAMCGHIIPPA